MIKPQTRYQRGNVTFWLPLLLVLSFSVNTLASEQAMTVADDPLIGLWGGERFFSSAAPFNVTISTVDGQLVAQAQGQSTKVAFDKQRVEFTFDRGLGAFRGQLDPVDNRIYGHWITQAGEVVFSPMASPLTLSPIGKGNWRAELHPAEQRFSLYIKVSKDENGSLRAFLRNPQRNQGVSTRLHTVKQHGEALEFTDRNGNTVLAGTFNQDNDTMSVAMPWRGGTYDLTRRERHSAPGFYPRRDTEPYRYQQPNEHNDGWSIATPNSTGLSQHHLEKFIQSILDTETQSVRSPYIHSVLIARRGKLVMEEYFYGHHQDLTHDLRSATKSVTGLMVGTLIDEIEHIDINSPVYPMFRGTKETTDKQVEALALQHLLSMSSGFDCDDNNYETPGNEDRMQEQRDELDWFEYTLALPFVASPGDTAVYCSAGINLLGGIISSATGTWLPEYFRTRFAVPLQIERYHMNLDPMGRGYAGGGINMRPRDFLKFAQLMLDKGTWNDQRVLPASWVEASFKAHSSIYQPDDYGYAWWRGEWMSDNGPIETFLATGNGGQILIVIPELDMAIGLTGGNYGDFRTWSAWSNELVPQHLLKAITN